MLNYEPTINMDLRLFYGVFHIKYSMNWGHKVH